MLQYSFHTVETLLWAVLLLFLSTTLRSIVVLIKEFQFNVVCLMMNNCSAWEQTKWKAL